jgi:hypothetical protein
MPLLISGMDLSNPTDLFVFIAEVVEGRMRRRDLLVHGKVELLICVEFLNSIKDVLLLYLANMATVCCCVV